MFLSVAMKKIQDLLHALNSNKPTENDKEELVFPEVSLNTEGTVIICN